MPSRKPRVRLKKTITKCGFRTKSDNAHVHAVAFNDLKDGELLALVHALMIARVVSPVADDMSAYLRDALQEAGKGQPESAKCHGFLKELNGDLGLVVIRREDLEVMRSKITDPKPLLFRVTVTLPNEPSPFEATNVSLGELGNTISSMATSAAKASGLTMTWKVEVQPEEQVPWTNEQKQALLGVADSMLESLR